MKKWIVIVCIVVSSNVFSQTNSGDNKPVSGETVKEEQPSKNIDIALDEENEATKVDNNESPFSLYKDTYLLAGYSNSSLNKDLVFKFQISAKFRMPVPGIYLAYTQRSFMDVLEDSAPFTDHNFEPEIYYVNSFAEKRLIRSAQIGYRHGSNGLTGVPSRSWERIYLEAEFKRNGIYVRPTVWFPFFKEPGNADVEKYWGYGELLLAYVWENDVRVSALFHAGTDWPKGKAKIDVTLPFAMFFDHPAQGWKQSNLWFQVFHGYGETFLGLKESSTAVAVGVGFRPDFDK
jgi:outer membrane phospholipase A